MRHSWRPSCTEAKVYNYVLLPFGNGSLSSVVFTRGSSGTSSSVNCYNTDKVVLKSTGVDAEDEQVTCGNFGFDPGGGGAGGYGARV